MTEVLDCNVQITPALARVIFYYSIASRSAACSLDILSNSSMQQTPLSAMTKAPASMLELPSSSFRPTELTKPHEEVPLPLI